MTPIVPTTINNVSTLPAPAPGNDDARVTTTIISVVDPLWFDFCDEGDPLFRTDHCGYWARGVAYDEERGWLVYEDDEKCKPGKEPHHDEAIAAWIENRDLPEHWFRLDRAAAIRAWAEGVKSDGEHWFEEGDATDYDVALQMALLGEVRYG